MPGNGYHLFGGGIRWTQTLAVSLTSAYDTDQWNWRITYETPM